LQIYFSKQTKLEESKVAPVCLEVLFNLYPGSKAIDMPALLKKEEISWVLEKEDTLIFVCVWQENYSLDQMTALLEFKVKWQHFVESLGQENEIIICILGQEIPQAVIEMGKALDIPVDILELIVSKNDDCVMVQQWMKKSHAFPNPVVKPVVDKKKVVPPNQKLPQKEEVSVEKNNAISLTSFFYKMGKLSEGELEDFLELEEKVKKIYS